MTMLNTLNSVEETKTAVSLRKITSKHLKLNGDSTVRLKQYNTPFRAEFISWSRSPKAAVPFRERLSAVIAPSCRAPLMFLPLASKTWSKGWASSLFALGFNRNLGHVTQTARLSRCGDTPFSCYPLISSWTPLPTTIFSSPLPSAPLVYCSLFCSAFSRGHWGEGLLSCL